MHTGVIAFSWNSHWLNWTSFWTEHKLNPLLLFFQGVWGFACWTFSSKRRKPWGCSSAPDHTSNTSPENASGNMRRNRTRRGRQVLSTQKNQPEWLQWIDVASVCAIFSPLGEALFQRVWQNEEQALVLTKWERNILSVAVVLRYWKSNEILISRGVFCRKLK